MDDIFAFYFGPIVWTSMLMLLAIVARLMLSKQSARFRCVIWILLLLRLLCPVSIETSYRVMPDSDILTAFEEKKDAYTLHLDMPAGLHDDLRQNGNSSVNSSSTNVSSKKIMQCVWYIGIMALSLYALIQYLSILKKSRWRTKCPEENVYEWSDQTGACVIGLFHPCIMIPNGLTGEDRTYVIRHEQMHIYRKDHVFILLYYIAFVLYWYHPLCWLIYCFVQQDIEFACDEDVLKNADYKECTQYAQTLIKLSQASYDNRRGLTFSGNIKKRIVHIGKKHKVRFGLYAIIWIVGGGVLLLTAIRYQGKNYSTLMQQKSQETFDAQMPRLLYATDSYVLLEDNQGIYQYLLENKSISGCCDFAQLGLGGMEGEDAVAVWVGNEGKQVYLESLGSDASIRYVYDVDQDHVKPYDGNILADMICEMPIVNQSYVNDQYSSLGYAYELDDNICFLALKNKPNPTYADIVYVVKDKTGDHIYEVFQ